MFGQPFRRHGRIRHMSLEQRLADWITSGDQVWVSLRDCGLPREQVDVVASRHDREVIWQCTDDTDQWMLIGEPDDLPIPASAPLVPYNLAVVLPWLALVLSVGVVVYLLSATDKSTVAPLGNRRAGLVGELGVDAAKSRGAAPDRTAGTGVQRQGRGQDRGQPLLALAVPHLAAGCDRPTATATRASRRTTSARPSFS